jgi:hypothetical protein
MSAGTLTRGDQGLSVWKTKRGASVEAAKVAKTDATARTHLKRNLVLIPDAAAHW